MNSANPKDQQAHRKRGKIIFKNKPKFSEFEAHQAFNERREKLIPLIEKFISGHTFFKDKEVQVSYMQRGVGSIVCLIESLDGKFILKIPLSINFATGEAEFLEKWTSVGIKTPKIFETGKIGGHHYTVMEYISEPALNEKYSGAQLLAMNVFVDLGKTLRKMHEPRAKGFGRMVNGNGEFDTFHRWILSDEIQRRIKYVRDNKVLGEEHGSLENALSALNNFIDTQQGTSYCHDDFNVSNIFATEPITVFDPNPKFNIGYLDLARSMLPGITKEKSTENEQLTLGYFGDERYDDKVLHSALMLNCYIKSFDWHKKKKQEFIEGARRYLSRRRELVS